MRLFMLGGIEERKFLADRKTSLARQGKEHKNILQIPNQETTKF